MEERVKLYEPRIKELYGIIEPIAPKLPYHNLDHMLDVSNSCCRYAQLENLKSKYTFILKTAGLLHDVVYILGRRDNEERSVEISRNILSGKHGELTIIFLK